MTLYRWAGKLLRRAAYGGIAKSASCCCVSKCCSKLPDTVYAHVTFTCSGVTYTSVHAMTEAAYTGPCLTNKEDPRVWEVTNASVNDGKGTMLIRFACTGGTAGAGTYSGCHNGCNYTVGPCEACPNGGTGWTILATNRQCTETTYGSMTITPAPSSCGSCGFPPAPTATITFKSTP